MRYRFWTRKTALTLSMLLLFPVNVYASAGPIGDSVDTGYSEEVWERLQDNVLEYDEIPLLVHKYNTAISDVWEELDETRTDLIRNIEEIESHEREMERLKEAAEDDGEEYSVIGNYAMQEAILDQVAAGLKTTAYSSLLSRTTLSSLQKAENQVVKAAQSLMISYDGLIKQREVVQQMTNLYKELYLLTEKQYSLGIVTEQDVLRAQSSYLSAESSLATLDGGLLQLRPVLCQLTGWPADAVPELSPIPSVDMARIDDMNLENDIVKAIGNNTSLIALRTSEKGKTSAGIEARLAVMDEGDEKLNIKMKKLYEDVQAKKMAADAANDGYQAALKSHAGYSRMYELGMLSRTDYLGTELAFCQAQAAHNTAETELLLTVETYHWAVKGLVELD